MKKIYIPKELVGALTAANVTVRDLTNPICLLNILSPDTVAFYFKSNVMFPDALPKIIHDTFGNAVDEEWLVITKRENENLFTQLQEVIIDARIETKDSSYEQPSGKLCWKIVDEDLIAFWHEDCEVTEGDFAENNSKSMKTRELCANLMRDLHSVFPFTEIAGLAIFHEYTRIAIRG